MRRIIPYLLAAGIATAPIAACSPPKPKVVSVSEVEEGKTPIWVSLRQEGNSFGYQVETSLPYGFGQRWFEDFENIEDLADNLSYTLRTHRFGVRVKEVDRGELIEHVIVKERKQTPISGSVVRFYPGDNCDDLVKRVVEVLADRGIDVAYKEVECEKDKRFRGICPYL